MAEMTANFSLWQKFYDVNGKILGESFEVSKFNLSLEQKNKMESKFIVPMWIFVPEKLSNQKNRHLLGRMFPKMQSSSTKENNSITNEIEQHGWICINGGTEAPYRDTMESDLLKITREKGTDGQTLNTYILGSQMSKFLTGHYFDEKTFSRTPSSRDHGFMFGASFGVDGSILDLLLANPARRDLDLGARFALSTINL